MALQHVNRRGELYYVLQGKTKSGKPKYYASKKNNGVPVEMLPEDFEVFEHADSAMVSIRKRKPSRLAPRHRDLICDYIRKLTDIRHFRVDIDGDNLIVYIPDQSGYRISRFVEELAGYSSRRLEEIVTRCSRYTAEFKFTLTNEGLERFSISRFCYSSGVDRWIHLRQGESLEKLAAKYLPHLGQESYFELF